MSSHMTTHIIPTSSQLSAARQLLSEANHIYNSNHDLYFDQENGSHVRHQVQQLLCDFVRCFDPNHVFTHDHLCFPMIVFTDTTAPSSFQHHVPEEKRSFYISIDGITISHTGNGGLYEKSPYGCYSRVDGDRRRRFFRTIKESLTEQKE